jgi:hypothetical protein
MLFIFSTPELIRNLLLLKTVVFLHWCLIRALPFENDGEKTEKSISQLPPTPDPERRPMNTSTYESIVQLLLTLLKYAIGADGRVADQQVVSVIVTVANDVVAVHYHVRSVPVSKCYKTLFSE